MSRSQKNQFFLTLILVLAFLLGACGAKSPGMTPSTEEMLLYESGSRSPVDAKMDTDASMAANSVPGQQEDRVVIKTADLSLVVASPDQSLLRIKQIAEALGGYVVSSSLNQTTLKNGTKVPHATISIRVPAERLDEAIAKIRQESKELPLVENVNSQDVTREYVDLESRLKNLRNTEEQLNTFLEDTKKTEETLAVYNELTRVREQIELIQGQIKYYRESADMSLINTELIANEAVQPLKIGGWELQGTFKDSVQGLVNFVQGLVRLLIRLVVQVIPILIILAVVFGLPIFLVVWLIVRRNRRGKLPPAQKMMVPPVPSSVSHPVTPPSTPSTGANPPPVS